MAVATAAPGRSCTPTPRSTGSRSRPTRLLTGVLREQLGLRPGTWSLTTSASSFLHSLHHVAADPGEAPRRIALARRRGRRAAHRRGLPRPVEQPAERLSDGGRRPGVAPGVDPEGGARAVTRRPLVPPERLRRRCCRTTTVARFPLPAARRSTWIHRGTAQWHGGSPRSRSSCNLADDGCLPVTSTPNRIAVIGPNGDTPWPLQGTYHFPAHVIPGADDLGIAIPTVADATRREWPRAQVQVVSGTAVSEPRLRTPPRPPVPPGTPIWCCWSSETCPACSAAAPSARAATPRTCNSQVGNGNSPSRSWHPARPPC